MTGQRSELGTVGRKVMPSGLPVEPRATAAGR